MSDGPPAASPRVHLLRVFPAVLAAPMALVVAGSLVVSATADPDVGLWSTQAVVLGLLLLAVPSLALVGALAAWRNRRRRLWAITGGFLILGLLPFGRTPQILLVGLLVLLGAVNTVSDRRWYDTWFALSMLVPLWGISALTYAYFPGHSAVMVAVGGAIIFGASVSVIAVTTNVAPVPGDNVALVPSDASAPATTQPGPVRRFLAGVARGPRWRPVWFGVAIWSITVSAFHFGGLAYGIYTQYWWWDVLTHGMSGFGVAAIIYLLRPAAFGSARRLLVLLPALVLVIGASFEVYEFVFRAFYHHWTPERYLEDTLSDLVVDVAGAVLFGLFPYTRLIGKRERRLRE